MDSAYILDSKLWKHYCFVVVHRSRAKFRPPAHPWDHACMCSLIKINNSNNNKFGPPAHSWDLACMCSLPMSLLPLMHGACIIKQRIPGQACSRSHLNLFYTPWAHALLWCHALLIMSSCFVMSSCYVNWERQTHPSSSISSSLKLRTQAQVVAWPWAWGFARNGAGRGRARAFPPTPPAWKIPLDLKPIKRRWEVGRSFFILITATREKCVSVRDSKKHQFLCSNFQMHKRPAVYAV